MFCAISTVRRHLARRCTSIRPTTGSLKPHQPDAPVLVLMLRTFNLTSKWGIPEAAQGIALGGVGIAPGKTRRPARVGRGSADPARMPDRRAPDARPTRWARVSCIGIWSVCTRTISRFPGKTGNGSDSRPRRLARRAGRGSPDPAVLPDRQVSPAYCRPRFRRCSCLQSLLPRKETYRSSIWAGSGDPRPARLSIWARSGVATVTGFAGESRYGPCTHGPYPNTGDPRPARARSRVAYNKKLRNI